jgi:hypothetical protein
MKPQAPGNVVIEDAVLPGFMRNFEGKEKQYNVKGKRNFCVLLTPEMAEALKNDGWNVKTLKAREPGDEPQPCRSRPATRSTPPRWSSSPPRAAPT